MRFKYRKSMKLPKRRQERIYCLCQSIDHLPSEERQRIRDICDATGYGEAVYEYITTDASSVQICNKHYVNHTSLAIKTAEVFRELARKI